MNIQLTFRDFPPSDAIRSHVEARAGRLLAHVGRVTALKVALESPHHHQAHGHSYRVRIELVVPGGEIVVAPCGDHDGHADLHAAIDDAFTVAERRARDSARVRRGDVKSHAEG
jgi:ribosome-associated translation inhibitor RaiA